MARVTYQLYPDFNSQEREVDEGTLTFGNSRKAIFTDSTSGDQLIFEGKGLDYDGGIITDGILRKLTVVDADGTMYLALSGMNLNTSILTGNTVLQQINAFTQSLVIMDLRLVCTNLADTVISTAGDDIVFGRRGDDTLGGGLGGDMLIGGAGNDAFTFAKGDGRDRIKDFDAFGGDGFQDHIKFEVDDIQSMTRSGRNTVIDFGDGDTLTLLGVRRGDIDQSDFI